MAGSPVSGGKLALGGVASLAIPELTKGIAVSDMTRAALLLVPTVVGLPLLVIGLIRMVKASKDRSAP